jgi:hypothetical protein
MLTETNIPVKIDDKATLKSSELKLQEIIVNVIVLLVSENGEILITESGEAIDLNRIF